MPTQRLGIVMHGVTGRMGMNQHLIRSIVAIRNQGGVALSNGDVCVPDPILIGRNAERLAALAKAQGIERWGTDLDQALENREDTVFFDAGTTQMRPTLLAKAIRAGKHVYCEKPLANDARTALALAAHARGAGLPATVGYSFRYGPAIQALRADVRGGVLGEPWLVELFEYNAQFHPSTGKPMNWKGDPAHAAAGALYEYGSHVVDLAGWLVGPIREVSASLTRVLPGARLDDIATLQFRFAEPAIGILVAGWVLSGSIPGIRIRLHGSEGLGEVEMSATVPGGQAYRRMALDGSIREEVALEPLSDPACGYASRHLADLVAIARGAPPRYPDTLPTLDDGARVQVVLEAALSATERWATVGGAAVPG